MNTPSKTKLFLVALAIIIGLIFLNLPSVSKRVKNFFYSISAPLSKQINSVLNGISNNWEFLTSLKEISKENIKLKEQVQKLKADKAKLQEVEEENKILRSSLDLDKKETYNIELADIINYNFQGLEKFIIINKGKLSGIKKSMPAVAFNNILIGKITEVFDDFSKIILINSSNIRVPSLIQESRASGIIKGNEQNKLLLDMVSKDDKVETGQTVISSSIGKDIPKGLLIGKVSYVEKQENKIFQYIEVTPAVNFEKLEQVFIIKK